jgi:transposase InsO family protein
MDGRGRYADNIFTESLWRTIKYEEVYLHEYTSPKEARQSLGSYIKFYNHERRIKLWATKHQPISIAIAKSTLRKE